MGLASEFKDFINKGNVVDLAVGVVIGGAFGKIVNSLVNDIIMPPIGMLISGVNFTDIKIKIKEASMDAAGKQIPAVTLNMGSFLQILLEFMIVAFAIFMVVKAVNRMREKQEAAPAAPPAPSKEEILLTEIRDLLKK
ncbi:MAG: large-conductance mechanosensitive channel protein MscL [Bacteroidetes bacterium]|nr:large-conductance mechanosensitive channel protein MscL [Bacteroidota bacterium]MBP6402501.1 large-conductance mechanosensitive channel protein MscL [Bacteroidia bacterium]MBK6838591.1 large-conductance mechanosensitive channel protein MscL [Bacteroidota bacterium]MBK9524864.1 large-conductance mechanosensitive channel protein MscL [Bacteroidota bacterium]MBK9543029.1 large-conductance mechanosensitive channel protein MscL [Bacteroidota bacterium]